MLTNKFIIISLTPAKSKYQYTWLGWQSRDQNRTPTHPFPLPLLFSNVRRIASKRPPTLFQLIIPLIAMIELSRLRLWLFTSKTKYAGRILIGRRSSCLNENALNESLPCCFSTRDPSQFFPSISLLTRRMVKKLLSKFFFLPSQWMSILTNISLRSCSFLDILCSKLVCLPLDVSRSITVLIRNFASSPLLNFSDFFFSRSLGVIFLFLDLSSLLEYIKLTRLILSTLKFLNTINLKWLSHRYTAIFMLYRNHIKTYKVTIFVLYIL